MSVTRRCVPRILALEVVPLKGGTSANVGWLTCEPGTQAFFRTKSRSLAHLSWLTRLVESCDHTSLEASRNGLLSRKTEGLDDWLLREMEFTACRCGGTP